MKTDDAINQFAATYDGSTPDIYKGDLNQWLFWCISDRVNPMNANPGEIIAYLSYLRNDVGLAPSSILRKFYSLRAFFTFIVTTGLLPRSPFEDVAIPYTELRGQAIEHKKKKRNHWNDAAAKTDDIQLKAILLLMAEPRIHMTDICSIQLTDIYPEVNQVSVNRRGIETALTVPVPTMKAIQDWLAVRDTHPKVKNVFIGVRDGNNLTLTNLKRRLNRAKEDLNNQVTLTNPT